MIRADMETACEANIDALTRGWSETIAYNVKRGKATEKRTKQRTYGPLLAEMREQVTAIMTANGGGPSYNPNHSVSRPPSNSHMSDAIDTIHEQAEKLLHWMRSHIVIVYGPNNTTPERAQHRSPESCLYEIRVMVRSAFLNDAEVASVLQTTSQMVRQARSLLGYEPRRVMLANKVCHVCSGALSVAEDASTDVECIGHPFDDPTKQEGPCGVVYSRLEWLDIMGSE